MASNAGVGGSNPSGRTIYLYFFAHGLSGEGSRLAVVAAFDTTLDYLHRIATYRKDVLKKSQVEHMDPRE
jgi:hypothetical protein